MATLIFISLLYIGGMVICFRILNTQPNGKKLVRGRDEDGYSYSKEVDIIEWKIESKLQLITSTLKSIFFPIYILYRLLNIIVINIKRKIMMFVQFWNNLPNY